MLEKSFDNIFIQTRSRDTHLDFWRDRIQRSVKFSSSHKRNRNRSCELVDNVNQINAIFHYLKAEHVKIRKELKNQEKVLKIFKTVDLCEENSSKTTEASTPCNKNSLNLDDQCLVTFKPGDRWTDCVKKKKHFPRDVFTVPKTNLNNLF